MCGNVANGFTTNYLKPYTEKGVTMRIFDVFYIFVEMWQCTLIKKYLKNINIYLLKNFFTKKIATFPRPFYCRKSKKQTSFL